MSRYISTTALVINKKAIGDNDLLITFLTPHLGKITAKAKGVRNIKSRRLSHIQLGNCINCHLYHKNESYWIDETESHESFLNYPKTITQTGLLFYYLELINNLIAANQTIPGVYEITINAITAINQNSVENFIKNEIDFLDKLGFGLPPEVHHQYLQKNYPQTQKLIKHFVESILEHPLESHKLFT